MNIFCYVVTVTVASTSYNAAAAATAAYVQLLITVADVLADIKAVPGTATSAANNAAYCCISNTDLGQCCSNSWL